MITPEFKEAFDRLNPEQKKAVDAIDGPVMVVAGPGTGKTEVLTLRIANILLKTDTRPEQILALTFTDSAAINMRKRLANIIGAPAFRVRIQTFHSFCNDILQRYPEYFPNIVGAKSVTEADISSIIEDIVTNAPLTLLRPWGDPLLYVGDIIRKIEELKREGLTPEKFEEDVSKTEKSYGSRPDLYHEKGVYIGKMKSEAIEYLKKIEKNKELALVYSEYQKKLRQKKLYDYSDMIMEVLNKLEDGKKKKGNNEENELKQVLQEEHQYILVDEHQDTNNAQNKILEILGDFHGNPNVFVVGDHKQAVFRFQGASVENFLHFKELYPKAVFIELFRNYRSTQGILDGADSIISQETKLESQSKLEDKLEAEKIKIAAFQSDTLEHCWVAEEIRKKKEVDEQTVAIIYRTNREAFAIAHALEKEGVKHVIESDEDLLADKYVRKLINILFAVNHYGDDLYLSAALHVEELGLDPLEAFKIIRSAYKSKKLIYDLLPEDIANKFKKWVSASKEDELPNFVEMVFRESGIFESALKSRDAEAFLGIDRIFEEAKRITSNKPSATLEDFIEYFNILETHKILLKRPKGNGIEGAVRLMTAHRAKGLEFDTVFIVNASLKSFGSKQNREMLPLILEIKKMEEESDRDHSEEDERRLFYVALTRAKKDLFITYHKRDVEGKELLPTPFLGEIKKEIVETLDTSKWQEKILKERERIYGGERKKSIRVIDKDFVAELFYKEQLSVTALNNYLDCPWKYFYMNLVRVPHIQNKYQIFGTAMHKTVEDFLKERKKGEVNKELLIDLFERNIHETLMPNIDIDEMLKKGKKSLSAWHEDRKNSWLLPYQLEMKIYGIKYKDLILSGKLDKVEFIDDTEVIVTDYKTGKPKSKNEIEGKTGDKTGNYKRQLVFYKLLLDLHDDGKLNMTKGVIEFLEPNESGKIKFEEFLIEKSEVEELKKTIDRVAEEITTLAFWDKHCDDPECEYCGYRKLLDK